MGKVCITYRASDQYCENTGHHRREIQNDPVFLLLFERMSQNFVCEGRKLQNLPHAAKWFAQLVFQPDPDPVTFTHKAQSFLVFR